MKKIISVVSVVAIVLVLFVWGKTNQAASEAGNGEVATTTTSTLSFPLTFHDFGTISMAAGKASKEFPVVNNTGRDLILERVETSCMCTSAYIKNGENRKGPFGMPGHGGAVPPADELIPAVHGPAGVGPIERQVFLRDDQGGQAVLQIKALVTS